MSESSLRKFHSPLEQALAPVLCVTCKFIYHLLLFFFNFIIIIIIILLLLLFQKSSISSLSEKTLALAMNKIFLFRARKNMKSCLPAMPTYHFDFYLSGILSVNQGHTTSVNRLKLASTFSCKRKVLSTAKIIQASRNFFILQ